MAHRHHNIDGSTVTVYSLRGPATVTAPSQRIRRAQTSNGTSVTEHGYGLTIAVPSPAKTDAAPLRNAPSAYAMLRRMRVSAHDAASFRHSGTLTTRPGHQFRSNVTHDQVYNRACVDFGYDGSNGHYHGCETQYKVWANGGDWYMEDSFLATATMHDTAIFNPDEVTGVLFGLQYSNGTRPAPPTWVPVKPQPAPSA